MNRTIKNTDLMIARWKDVDYTRQTMKACVGSVGHAIHNSRTYAVLRGSGNPEVAGALRLKLQSQVDKTPAQDQSR